MRVIETVLEPNPIRRFDSAKAMEQALAPPTMKRRGNRFRYLAATCIVIVAAMAAAITFGPRRHEPVTIPFGERDWVLVTAFENRTGDSSLDGVLEDALERELASSPSIAVVARSRMEETLRLMRRSSDIRVDAEVGRELAHRDGRIRAVITGRIEKLESKYAVTAHVLSPIGGPAVPGISEVSMPAGEEARVVAQIAAVVRRRVEEALPTIDPPRTDLAKVATSSMRALQFYSQALEGAGELAFFSNPSVAEKLLREAVREDPEFVWAHIQLARALNAQRGRHGEALQHLEQAVSSAKAGELDRYIAEAELDAFRGDTSSNPVERLRYLERALTGFDAVVHLDPEHLWAHRRAQTITAKLGRTSTPQRVAQYVELRPNNARVLLDGAGASLAAGRMADARDYVRRGRMLSVPVDAHNAPAVSWFRQFAAKDAWRQRQPAQALAEADAILTERPRDGSLFHLYLAMGRWDRAEQVASLVEPEVTRSRMHLIIANERGDRDAIVRHLAVLSAKYGEIAGGSGTLVAEIASALVNAGMVDHVRQMLAAIKESPRQGHGPLLPQIVEGMLATSDGRVAHGIRVLDQVVQRPDAFYGLTGLRASLVLAEAQAALGNNVRAIAVLENASTQSTRGNFWDSSALYVNVRDKLAQLYRRVGRVAEAEEIEADLRQLLVLAADDHPIKRRLNRAGS